MTTVFNDTFTAASDTTLASHTPDVGTGWTILWRDGSNPSFTVVAATDTCKGVTGNDSGVIYTADATYISADYEVEWTYVNGTNLTTRPYYVFVRLADVDNLYAVRCNAAASGFRLYKKVGGTWTALGSAFTVAVGSVCKLQIIGTTLKLFDDGVEVQSVTVSDLSAAGKGGIGSGGGAELVTSTDDANSLTEIDNFSVTDVGSGGTNYGLTATGVEAGTPGVDSPAATLGVSVAATGTDADVPTVGTAALTLACVFGAAEVSGGTPTLGTPAVSLDTATNYEVAAEGVDGGVPGVGSGVVALGVVVTANGVEAETPTVGTGGLTQGYSVGSGGVEGGTPVTGSPALVQWYALAAGEVATGAVSVGTAALFMGTITPTHSYAVAARRGATVVPARRGATRKGAENRRVVVSRDD